MTSSTTCHRPGCTEFGHVVLFADGAGELCGRPVHDGQKVHFCLRCGGTLYTLRRKAQRGAKVNHPSWFSGALPRVSA